MKEKCNEPKKQTNSDIEEPPSSGISGSDTLDVPPPMVFWYLGRQGTRINGGIVVSRMDYALRN